MYTATSTELSTGTAGKPPEIQVLWGHGCVVLEIEHRSDNMKDPETGCLFSSERVVVGGMNLVQKSSENIGIYRVFHLAMVAHSLFFWRVGLGDQLT